MFEIKVLDEPAELLEQVAEKMMALSCRAEPCHIALSGGSTPVALYRHIAASPIKDAIEWSNLHFWWGDERMVAAESNESNYGVAYRTLLEFMPIPKENIHAIRGDAPIDEELTRLTAESASSVAKYNDRPCFDWVLLGLGEDGHTASLFPGQVDYDEQADWVAVKHPQTAQPRISLSAETLCNARLISYLVTGAGKANIVAEIFADEGEQVDAKEHSYVADKYPAANIFAFEGETEWLIDRAAAQKLTQD